MKKNKYKLMRSESGFTLTELLIVIAIIGFIGTLVASNFIGKFQKAKVDTTKIQMRNLGQVLDNFKLDCGRYPTTDQGLDALLAKPTTGPECKNYDASGYLKDKKKPKDGFGNEFIYESDGNKYKMTSLGNDNTEGGEETNADIHSDDL